MSHTPETRRRAYEKVVRRKKEWFQENGPCAQCGSTERLELDHIDPSTKISHIIWSWSEVRRREELTKCQVLCRKCHEKKTARENSERMGTRHGTSNLYRRYKCRCDLCMKHRRKTKREDYKKAKAKKNLRR